MKKLRAGILGATGMVGQRFITLLQDHPWFEVTAVAASPRSAGRKYSEAVEGRWMMKESIPDSVASLMVTDVQNLEAIKPHIDFVFCALDMTKDEIKALEEKYAAADIPVVSNNSAHRWTEDVPMIIPEVNPDHAALIDIQRKNRGWKKGFIAVKPNCSIQSYVPALKPLEKFGPKRIFITTMQAISGAGKTFESWPEMVDNVIPNIGGENEKSEKEPLKVLGTVDAKGFHLKKDLVISAQCNRVAAADGHMANVVVEFEKNPTREEILNAWNTWENEAQKLGLPSAPKPFLIYRDEPDRPQTRLDRDSGSGMAVTIGRLREDNIFHWRFEALSHNTVRGAAGGAIEMAELLKAKGYL